MKKSRNSKGGAAQSQQPPKQPVAIKEMKMNALNFGEVVFGGDCEKNLKKELKLNQTIEREKKRQNSSPYNLFGMLKGMDSV